MDTFVDDGLILDSDVLWRRFIIFNADGSENDEARKDPETKLYYPTNKALRYLKDGMSSHSWIRINDLNLSMEDIVNNEDMPQAYICGISSLSVGELRKMKDFSLRFKEDPVVDKVIPLRGKCHVLWGTERLPPNDKEWRKVRNQFRPFMNPLPINQPSLNLKQ